MVEGVVWQGARLSKRASPLRVPHHDDLKVNRLCDENKLMVGPFKRFSIQVLVTFFERRAAAVTKIYTLSTDNTRLVFVIGADTVK